MTEPPLSSPAPADAPRPAHGGDEAGAPSGERAAPSHALRVLRGAEFMALFFGVPSLLAFGPYYTPVIPTLLLIAGVCGAVLLLDRRFERAQLMRLHRARRLAGPIALRFLVLGAALGAATLAWDLLDAERSILFEFPRRSTRTWIMVMLLYPLLSVYPQELIYRVFLFHRYAPAFGSGGAMIAASALAFGYGHIIFGHWLSIVMTVVAGALFASTYARTRSAAACWFEHTLYGDLIFTIGLGSLFYLGPPG